MNKEARIFFIYISYT